MVTAEPKPEACSVCGLLVAAWRIQRGKRVFCTWVCADKSRRASIDAKGASEPRPHL